MKTAKGYLMLFSACAAASVGVALAADAVATAPPSPPSVTVDLSPLVQLALTYLLPIIGTVLTFVVGWGVNEYKKRTGHMMDQATIDKFKSLAKGVAGQMMLSSPTNLAGVSMTFKSQPIADAAKAIMAHETDLQGDLQALGITPDWVAKMIASYLGQMQSNGTIMAVNNQPTAGSPGAAPPPPPGKALS